MNHKKILRLTSCAVFAAFLCICSLLVVPIGPVPFALQIFAVMLCAVTLDWAGAQLSVLVYLLIGLFLPLFSGGNTGVTADIYHMHNCGDGPDEIRLLGAAVKHGHISFPLEREGRNRTFPADAGEYGYREFLAALRDSGVTRCSVEAGTSDFASDCAAAAKMLRSIVL